MNSDGVVAPYCSTLTRVLAFFYASTIFLAVVLYLPHIFCVLSLTSVLGVLIPAATPSHTAAQKAAAE